MGADSIAQLEEAIREQPKYAAAHYNLGLRLAAKGEIDKAIEHFEQAVAIQPYYAGAWNGLGNAFLRKGDAAEAARDYERSLALEPESPSTLNGLAWIYATSPDASLRNGSRALKLATRAVEVSRRQDPILLRALAAAYAETGEFDKATAVANEALQLALAQSKSDLADRLKLELDLYQTKLPLRDVSLKSSQP
jgi:Flp pilus assembly protein TadD